MAIFQDELIGGTRRRLAALRATAGKMNTETIKNRKTGELFPRYRNAGNYTWRNVRYRTLRASSANWYGKPAHGRYIATGDNVVSGLREKGFSDELLNLRHRGYYADGYQDEIYRGQVWQLPARNGESRFICGYVEPNSGTVILSASNGRIDITDNERDAARWADQLAEREAERSREFSEADSRLTAAADDVSDARKEAGEIVALLREQKAVGPLAGGLCARLLSDFSAARERFHKALGELADARDHMAFVERVNG